MRHFLWILVLLSAWTPSVHAQETGLSFLRVGVSAAANAMGDAHTATTKDALSTFTNPAGLAAMTSNMAVLSYRKWVGNLRAYDAASRFRVGTKGAIGLAVLATDSGELEARDGPGDPIGTFRAQFVSAGIAYARKFGSLRVGVTAKYLRESILEADASGYAVDVGVQLDMIRQSLLFGVALQNVGRMSRLDQEVTRLPRILRGGVALHPIRVLAATDNTRLFDLMVAGEVSHLFLSDVTRMHVGMVATVLEMLKARAGYVSQDALRDFTFGLGVDYTPFVLDYAYIPFEDGFEGPGHVLTLMYAW